MNKRPEAVKRTKRGLAEALVGKLGQRDIGSISVKELTAAAGVSRSTFYLYFDDVYALRAAIEDDLIAQVEAALAEMPTGPLLEDDAVRRMAAVYERCGERINLFVRTDPAFARRVKSVLGGYLRGIADGRSMGPARDGADWQEDLAIEIASSALIGGLEYWFENRRRISAEQAIPRLRKAVFAALPFPAVGRQEIPKVERSCGHFTGRSGRGDCVRSWE